VSNNLGASFCGLVIIKLERALFEFYGSLDVGLNFSVRKLQLLSGAAVPIPILLTPPSTTPCEL